MALLRLLSWPYVRSHRVRTLLTLLGVVIGVAVLVGMRTANQSVVTAFTQTVDRIAGKTELQVTAGDAGFGENVLEIVQAAPAVRVAVPVIEALADSTVRGQGTLLILGIDMTGDRSLREYDLDGADDDVIDDPLIFLAQPDSLILSSDFASRHRIARGDHLTLGTAEGEKTFTVRGIMRSSGLASAFGGNLAMMDVYAAQRMFGRGRTFDRIDLTTRPGTAIADAEQELRDRLGPAFVVQRPSGRGRQFESMLAGYSMMMTLSSAFALFIGMFIIYNSFSIAVTQRRAEIGVLRALGASRSQIRTVFLGEGLVLGLVGSTLGAGAGLLMARLITGTISQLLTDVYGVAPHADTIVVDVRTIAIAIALGVVTSLAATLVPSRRAALVDPIDALKRGAAQMLPAMESRRRIAAAVAIAAVSTALLAVSSWRPLFYGGYALALLAAVIVVPVLSTCLARATRPIVRWIRPVEGSLAADSLIQAPARTTASVAALMLSLALVVAFSGMARSSVGSIVEWMNTSLDPNLFVLPSQSLDNQTTRFPASMASEIAAIPGVASVQMERDARVPFRGRQVMVVAHELAAMAKTDRRRPVAGRADEMYARAAAGEGLIVADALAEMQGLRLGEVLEIPAPCGTVRLPISGIVVDYSDQQGAILMDRSVFLRHWCDDAVSAYRVYVAADATPASVRRQILDRYAGKRRVFVLTNDELKSYILNVVNQWFSLTTVQIGVAVLVAILGVVNTLTVSVADRRRELAVLRAVGASRAQVRHAIWIEAVCIAAVGLVLGCALGAVNLYYVLEIARRDIAGTRLAYDFPYSAVMVLVPIISVAAFLASVWPAEAAVRGPLVEALEYE
jgi:putative ABC transport system permease protein